MNTYTLTEEQLTESIKEQILRFIPANSHETADTNWAVRRAIKNILTDMKVLSSHNLLKKRGAKPTISEEKLMRRRVTRQGKVPKK